MKNRTKIKRLMKSKADFLERMNAIDKTIVKVNWKNIKFIRNQKYDTILGYTDIKMIKQNILESSANQIL